LAITAAVMVTEAVGGWLAHSLALLADAGHMLAAVAALGLSLVVTALAQRPVTAERTFGLLRLEILAALVNGAALIVIALGIGLEAYHRFRSPADVTTPSTSAAPTSTSSATSWARWAHSLRA